jgi:PAS domain S-box-containing protein
LSIRASHDRSSPLGHRQAGDAVLRRLFDANVIGIVISNNAGAILEANDAFLATIGFTRDELTSGAVDWRTLTPPEWLPLDERAIAEMAATGVFAVYEKEYVRKDGTRVPVSLGGARLADSAEEQVCFILDLSPIRSAEAALRRSEQRYRILAEALPQIIMLADERRHMLYVNRRYTEYTGVAADDVGGAWREVIHPEDLPAVDAVRASGEPYEIEYRLRRKADGAFRWHFARCSKVPGDDARTYWLASAMDIDDRKRAEDALRFIERAGARLSQSLDLQATFETLLDLVVPEFGDWATITLRTEAGGFETILARHKDPEKADLTRRLCGVNFLDDAHSWGTTAVYQTGAPEFGSTVSEEAMRTAVREEFYPIVDRLGYGSYIILPILSGDAVIGTLGIISAGNSRTYSAGDIAPLRELTGRAGYAIANARRYAREHRVASVLQEAALPRHLPEIEGFHFDGYYRAGREESAIGGDWFDAVVVADGHVVVSVGDVTGSGLEAAVLMSTVRQVIRGAAHVRPDPLMILEVADRALRGEDENGLVTAFVGVIDPRTRVMRYASAGHWPGLLRSRDGAVLRLEAQGLPLGLRGLSGSKLQSVVLEQGSSLLLYTDGLVEFARDVFSGERLLTECFAETPATERPAKHLVERVLGDNPARDDIAALVVGVDARASVQ